ncbi:protein kinase [Psychrobacter sp.]|uniref:protein kinase domain-containing protein n=1 Tax=Psychrobacter sp. TaxID=56811 RepID=UPI0025F7947B|nr:protein kinase [Psychrobacter sp.]
MQNFNDPTQHFMIKAVNQHLSKLGYRSVETIRFSYEPNCQQRSMSKAMSYQGLTKASYKQKSYMLKWQLSSSSLNNPTNLDNEIEVIKQLQQTSLNVDQGLINHAFIAPQNIGMADGLYNDCLHTGYLDDVFLDTKSLNTNSLKSNCLKCNWLDDNRWQFSSLVMPYFIKGSLKDYLSLNELSNQHKAQLAINLAMCIQWLHSQGWVHGDIKPSNFLLNSLPDSQVNSNINSMVIHNIFEPQFKQLKGEGTQLTPIAYLNDWACARPLVQDNDLRTYKAVYPTFKESVEKQSVEKQSIEKQSAEKQSTVESCSVIKSKGLERKMRKGTPAYFAPECWHGSQITSQSDLYAFGITLFELFEERKPYQLSKFRIEHTPSFDIEATSLDEKYDYLSEWAILHCQQNIPLLSDPFRMFQPVIDKLLAKKIENRYPTIEDTITALQNIHL